VDSDDRVTHHEPIANRIAGNRLGENQEFIVRQVNTNLMNQADQNTVINLLKRGLPVMLTDAPNAHKQIIYGYSKNAQGDVTFKVHDPGYTGYTRFETSGPNAGKLAYDRFDKRTGLNIPVADRRIDTIRFYERVNKISF